MQATIQAPSDQIPSLLEWLRRERLEDVTVARATAAPGPDEMGFDAAAVEVVLAAPAIVALAGSVGVWLRMRKSDVKIRISSRGRQVDIESSNVQDAERLIREVLDGVE